MHNTRNVDDIALALVDLLGFYSSPQRRKTLVGEAGVDLDRALLPLLVCLDLRGPLSVAALAEQVGRDHTTVSRQLAKLQSLGLVQRPEGADRRVRAARITPDGERIAQAVTAARQRLLGKALADWTDADRTALATLSRRFVDALTDAARA